MKLIDEKGRLFGLINIVDFSIVVAVIIITLIFSCVYNLLVTKPAWGQSRWIKVEAITFALPETAESFKASEVAHNVFGHLIGRILRVIEKDTEYGNKVKQLIIEKTNHAEYEYRVPVFLELELLCTKGTKSGPWYYPWHFVKYQLFVGSPFDHVFQTEKCRIIFYVLKMKE